MRIPILLAHFGYLDQVVRFSLFKTSAELSAVQFCSQQLNNAMKTRCRLYGEVPGGAMNVIPMPSQV